MRFSVQDSQVTRGISKSTVWIMLFLLLHRMDFPDQISSFSQLVFKNSKKMEKLGSSWKIEHTHKDRRVWATPKMKM